MNNPLWYSLHTLVDLLRRRQYMMCTDMPDTYCIFNKIHKTKISIYNASNSGPYKKNVTEKRISCQFCFVPWQEYSYFRQ